MIGASDGPIIAGTLVTPSDSTIFSQATRGLYIGGGGNLNVEFAIPQPSDTMNNYSNTNVYSNVVFTAVVRWNYSSCSGKTCICGKYFGNGNRGVILKC